MDKISKSLNDSLLSSTTDDAAKSLTELITDISEINLDSLIENDLVKEIPIIKTIMVFPKIVKGISNYLFIQKIIRFLFHLRKTTLKERQKFLKSLNSNRREEILSNLVLILDKHDHLKKSELQGKLFGAYIKGQIKYQEYMSLTHSINMMDITTFPTLIEFYMKRSTKIKNPEQIYNFIFLQLIRIDESKAGTYGYRGPEYKRNRLGKLLVEIGAEVKISDENKKQILK